MMQMTKYLHLISQMPVEKTKAELLADKSFTENKEKILKKENKSCHSQGWQAKKKKAGVLIIISLKPSHSFTNDMLVIRPH